MYNLNHRTPQTFAQGTCYSDRWVHPVYLGYKIVVALSVAAALLWSMVVKWHNGKWFIYHAHWGHILLTLHMVMSAAIIVHAYVIERRHSNILNEELHMPLTYKVYWIVYSVSLPNTLFVSASYWLFLREPTDETGSSFVYYVMNTILALGEVITGKIDINCVHIIHLWCFNGVYVVFNVIYWVCGGTDINGNAEIYKQLNWHDVNKATLNVFVSWAILTGFYFLVMIFNSMRRNPFCSIAPLYAHS